MKVGGIILCGGRSTRMGRAKLTLPFGPELMLQRVVRLLGQVAQSIIIVAAPDQELPPLPGDVVIVRDRREGRGPLEGILAGLSACQENVDAAYVTSCDVPLLAPAFVQRMIELLGDYDIAVPVSDGFEHPLAAVYRPSVVPNIEQLLAADRLRPVFLFNLVRTRRVQPDELTDVDPLLATLENCNRPEDYLAALAKAGYSPPADWAPSQG